MQENANIEIKDKFAKKDETILDISNKAVDLMEKDINGGKQWLNVKHIPYNAESGYEYNGINLVNLALSEFDDPRWITVNQIKNESERSSVFLDYRGLKSKRLINYLPIQEKKDGKAVWDSNRKPVYLKDEFGRMKRSLTVFNVFNASEVKGYPTTFDVKEPKFTANDLLEVMHLDGVTIEHGDFDISTYNVESDTIQIKNKESFKNDNDYYSTLVNLISKATGNIKRLAIEPLGKEDKEYTYAYEELVSELNSYFIMANMGMEYNSKIIDNRNEKIEKWIKIMKESNSLDSQFTQPKGEKFFKSATEKAKAATRYQLGKVKEFQENNVNNTRMEDDIPF